MQGPESLRCVSHLESMRPLSLHVWQKSDKYAERDRPPTRAARSPLSGHKAHLAPDVPICVVKGEMGRRVVRRTFEELRGDRRRIGASVCVVNASARSRNFGSSKTRVTESVTALDEGLLLRRLIPTPDQPTCTVHGRGRIRSKRVGPISEDLVGDLGVPHFGLASLWGLDHGSKRCPTSSSLNSHSAAACSSSSR
jgi:hypothetical protein